MGHNVSCVLEPALPDSLYECLQDECIKSDVKRGCKRPDTAAPSYNTRLRDGLDTQMCIRDRQWAQLVKEAAYTPQEGELFWQYWFDENPQVVVDGKKAVEQLSEHRFSTLSFLHSYLERRDDENTMMARWKRQPMTCLLYTSCSCPAAAVL